ncbi:hypothetical protein [Hymenobacter latericus]|uniref:hypothetical protein n=1 Tax=Hymenobacter sp. YIM 151858-1 TaxID=2987688 RepID=UPI0022280141|nr:hypothetical protein [Hymenobacter sp. YIM 151858-1]UYZ60094.1 hypothetical protein OIS50_04660 [Hymenobacter sp. YIM 151858-1]
MSETAENQSLPTAEPSLADAFRNAVPVGQAAPAPAQTPEVSAPAADAAAIAPGTVDSAPQAVAPAEPAAPQAPAFDEAAYLREKFGVETPAALAERLKAAEEAQTLKQQLAEENALRKWVHDNPQEARAYFELQSTDFEAMDTKEVLRAKFLHDNPGLTGRLAEVKFEREFATKYGAADFDDPDSIEAEEARLMLDYDGTQARAAMNTIKEEAKQKLPAPATPAESGPSAEEVAQYEANWISGVEQSIAEDLDIEFPTDGDQTISVKLTKDDLAILKDQMLDPIGSLQAEVVKDGQNDFSALLRRSIGGNPQVMKVALQRAFEAGKKSVGAVIPMSTAVNPPAAVAPTVASGSDRGGLANAFRQAAQQAQYQNNLHR